MRRDLIVTALIFIVIGFVGGYVFTRQAGKSGATLSSPLMGGAQSADEAMGLPPGHPPMDISQRIIELRQEAERNPDDAVAALRLADFLFEVGRCQDAVAWYERALARAPKEIDARIKMASCLTEIGQADAAIRHLNTVLELKPNEPHALYHLAVAYLRGKQNRAEAERIYRRLRQVNPNFEGLDDLERLLRPPAGGGR